MRTGELLVALSLVVASAAGCSSFSVTTDHDETMDFAALRTWDWMQRPAGAPDPFHGNTLVGNRVRAAVERELAGKGLVRSGDSPSVVVALHTAARDRLDATTWPSWGAGWRRRRGYLGYERVTIHQWTEGTLIVDLVDPATKDLVWRGTVSSVLAGDSGSAERVDAAVQELFEAFPPK